MSVSLQRLAKLLEDKVAAPAIYSNINTRLILQLGVSLKAVAPEQNTDQSVVRKVLAALQRMGINLEAEMMSQRASTARSAQRDSRRAAEELVEKLGAADPACVLFFAGLEHDGAAIGATLARRFGEAEIVGCSANGEFCDHGFGKGGVAAMALPRGWVKRCAATLARLDGGVSEGVGQAAAALSQKLGVSLRHLDPERFACLALVEGGRGQEEAINEALGNVCPFVPFVGGSAGDNIAYQRTWVFADGAIESNACALMVLELVAPHVVLKTCNYVATERTVVVTKAVGRVVLELDGEPAAPYYADAIGTSADKLAFLDFMPHPLGLMIDGQPWLRSGIRVADGKGIYFACSMMEGMRLHFMRGVDLVSHTRAALARAEQQLGAPISGAVLFNCAYRMLEAETHRCEAAYHETLSRFAHVGMHTNGESYIGHINQTLTGLLFA
jgi:hypothetical protein